MGINAGQTPPHLLYNGVSNFGGVAAPGNYTFILSTAGNNFHAHFLGYLPANTLSVQVRIVVTAQTGNGVPNLIMYQKVPGLNNASIGSQYFSYHGRVTASPPAGAKPWNVVLNGIFQYGPTPAVGTISATPDTNYDAITGPNGYPLYATTATSAVTGTTQILAPALGPIMLFAYNTGINTNTWSSTVAVNVVLPPS